MQHIVSNPEQMFVVLFLLKTVKKEKKEKTPEPAFQMRVT